MPEKSEEIPFYPDHVYTILRVTGGVMAAVFIIGALGLAFPVGSGDPADPLNTPAHIKPEWYFLALYQALKFMPKTVGAALPVIILGALVLLPFIDRKPDASPRARRARVVVTVTVLILAAALTIWGEVS